MKFPELVRVVRFESEKQVHDKCSEGGRYYLRFYLGGIGFPAFEVYEATYRRITPVITIMQVTWEERFFFGFSLGSQKIVKIALANGAQSSVLRLEAQA